jgi:endonuclease YncB( thermonuclease family)
MAQEHAPPLSRGGAMIAQGTIAQVINASALTLDDGREVRLAATEVPPLSAGAAPGGAAAKTALDALIGGDAVVLRGADMAADRYGRLVAYASPVRDGDEVFAQGETLAVGFARAADRIGCRACAAELLPLEDAARRAKLGLWADPYYEVLAAAASTDVLARRGRFALVEGQVVSVRESGDTIYVNFGLRWSEDFSVTVQKRNERNFAAADVDVKAQAGRVVRVRGVIEQRERACPLIEAQRPEQIETADLETR